LSDVNNSDEIPVEVLSDDPVKINDSTQKSEHTDNVEHTVEELTQLLDLEKQKTSQFEEKLKMYWQISKILVEKHNLI